MTYTVIKETLVVNTVLKISAWLSEHLPESLEILQCHRHQGHHRLLQYGSNNNIPPDPILVDLVFLDVNRREMSSYYTRVLIK